MTAERVEIYHHVPPPGRSIPMEVTPFPAEDSITGYADISETVKHLRLNRLGGPSGIQAEHLCQWLREATREEDPNIANWDKVSAIVHAEFGGGGYVSKAFACQTVMLTPKGDGKDFHGISILEVPWKSTTRIIDRWITTVITYHEILH